MYQNPSNNLFYRYLDYNWRTTNKNISVPTILYFLEKGAQPTGTVHDISRKAGVFMDLSLN